MRSDTKGRLSDISESNICKRPASFLLSNLLHAIPVYHPRGFQEFKTPWEYVWQSPTSPLNSFASTLAFLPVTVSFPVSLEPCPPEALTVKQTQAFHEYTILPTLKYTPTHMHTCAPTQNLIHTYILYYTCIWFFYKHQYQ